jgi:hypothetical protein
MNNSQITSKLAKQILFEAERNGIAVEVYLKKIASEENDNGKKREIRQAAIKYDFTESQKWLEENAKKYVGHWVVLDGNRLIGYGSNPLPFVEKARNEGVKVPFVQFINDDSEPFMGGWL